MRVFGGSVEMDFGEARDDDDDDECHHQLHRKIYLVSDPVFPRIPAHSKSHAISKIYFGGHFHNLYS